MLVTCYQTWGLTLALARDVLSAVLVKLDLCDLVLARLVLGDCFVPRAETEQNELIRVDEEVLVKICLAHLLLLLRFGVGVEHPVDHLLIDLLVESSVVAVDDRVELGCLKVGEVFVCVRSRRLGWLTWSLKELVASKLSKSSL